MALASIGVLFALAKCEANKSKEGDTIIITDPKPYPGIDFEQYIGMKGKLTKDLRYPFCVIELENKESFIFDRSEFRKVEEN
jgi:uncharacterized alpha/beta hydrolase family protein